MLRRIVFVCVSLLGCAALGGASPQALELEKLIPKGPGWEEARFGATLAVAGDLAVACSPGRAQANGQREGLAHVFRRSGVLWHFEQTLRPTGGNTRESFGSSVATDGTTIVIGSYLPLADDDGAAYVFRRVGGQWEQEARLRESPSLPSGYGDFGYSVAVSGNTVAVGDPAAFGTGRAYVYVRTNLGNWALQAVIASAGSLAGIGVALDGDRLAVGLGRTSQVLRDSVVIYQRSGSTWALEATLNPDSVPYGQYFADEFGRSLDLVGSTLVVGAPGDRNPADTNSAERGAVFVFRRSGGVWGLYARIDPLVVAPRSRFGAAVALHGESFLAVGAPGTAVGAPPVTTRGVVHIYELTGGLWLHRHELRDINYPDNENLGASVAVTTGPTGRTVLAGKPGAGVDGAGRVRINGVGTGGVSNEGGLDEPALGGSGFGQVIAIDGAYAVVGAPDEDQYEGDDIGAAYLFRREGADWRFHGRIAPNGRSPGDRFGSRVAIRGDVIAISAPGNDLGNFTDVGAVYVLRITPPSDTPVFEMSVAHIGASGEGLGTSLALFDDMFVAGAPGNDNAAGVDAGAAYVYTRNGGVWGQSAKLASNDLAAGDRFGSAVAISSSTRVIVGAELANAAGTDSGAVYVMDRIPIIGGVAWIERRKLVPPTLAAGDRLGSAVGVFGTTVAAGAPLADLAPLSNAGRLYVYVSSGNFPGQPGNTFTLVQSLTDSSPITDGGFGARFSLFGSELAVGIPSAAVNGNQRAGRVGLYRRTSNGTYGSLQTLTASDPGAQERFGQSMALGTNTLLAGAPLDTNSAGDLAGGAYVFDLWLGGGFGSEYCTALANSTGQPARVSALGTPVVAQADLRIRAQQLPPNTTGYFIVGRAPGFATSGSTTGNLCVSGLLGRFTGPGQVLSSGASGSFELSIPLTAIPQPGGSVVGIPGDTWYFQAWFRDSFPAGFTSNLSTGVAVVLH